MSAPLELYLFRVLPQTPQPASQCGSCLRTWQILGRMLETLATGPAGVITATLEMAPPKALRRGYLNILTPHPSFLLLLVRQLRGGSSLPVPRASQWDLAPGAHSNNCWDEPPIPDCLPFPLLLPHSLLSASQAHFPNKLLAPKSLS